ncbi:Ankyrin repeat and SOCS box protein 1 [Tupaia chinensis]|uniref:Ankyrin repeat and SOCS box protein 1 n=1 Tax=Tupaia chinensis TaxID=246437 RepID=L9KQV2_TUPCH|nr:Ankyrin repeat and SOCS box protein 1 [Tupaia chinensis]
MVSGEPLLAKPARIVAGHEPERTNELLQTLGKCCLHKLSSDDAVKRVLAGEKADVKGRASLTSRPQELDNKNAREEGSRVHKDKEVELHCGQAGRPTLTQARVWALLSAAGGAAGRAPASSVIGTSLLHSADPYSEDAACAVTLACDESFEGKVNPRATGDSTSDAEADVGPPGQDKSEVSEHSEIPNEMSVSVRTGSSKTASNVIIESQNSDNEEDEQFVVEAAPQLSEMSEMDLEKSLVFESAWKKEKEIVSKEIEKLRVSIQTLCKSALPLGKIMDYIQEDVDAMQNELQLWHGENKQHAEALRKEQSVTDSAVEPLKAELAELEQLIKEQQDRICAVKASILKNEEKIQKMVYSITLTSRRCQHHPLGRAVSPDMLRPVALVPCHARGTVASLAASPAVLVRMITGPNLKEWLREQFCDHPLEHCEDTRLHDAAYVGDLQTLRSLLQEESYRSRINEKSVWCCGWLPCTPLRIAATAGHGNCVDFLIRKGAEVDLVDVKGQTALYVAVVNGHLESAQILLEAGADPNGSRHHRSTPVYHASRVGRADILKALIRYGADVDVNHHLTPDIRPPFSRRLTSLVVCPLYISAAYHNLQCFQLLLQAGANPDFNCNGPVNTQGFYRGSPGCVMDAVLRHGCEAAFVSLLVEFGANLNLVKWESLGPESRGRRKVDPEALQVFKEARTRALVPSRTHPHEAMALTVSDILGELPSLTFHRRYFGDALPEKRDGNVPAVVLCTHVCVRTYGVSSGCGVGVEQLVKGTVIEVNVSDWACDTGGMAIGENVPKFPTILKMMAAEMLSYCPAFLEVTAGVQHADRWPSERPGPALQHLSVASSHGPHHAKDQRLPVQATVRCGALSPVISPVAHHSCVPVQTMSSGRRGGVFLSITKLQLPAERSPGSSVSKQSQRKQTAVCQDPRALGCPRDLTTLWMKGLSVSSWGRAPWDGVKGVAAFGDYWALTDVGMKPKMHTLP